MSESPGNIRDLLNVWDPRGRMSRGVYAAVLGGSVAAGVLAWQLAQVGPVAAWIAVALALLLAWCVAAAAARRLHDAGISRLWLLLPAFVSVATFSIVAWNYHPPPIGAQVTGFMRFLAIITIVPALLAGFAWLVLKLFAGLMAAAVVWAVFILLLLFPRSVAGDVA